MIFTVSVVTLGTVELICALQSKRRLKDNSVSFSGSRSASIHVGSPVSFVRNQENWFELFFTMIRIGAGDHGGALVLYIISANV